VSTPRTSNGLVRPADVVLPPVERIVLDIVRDDRIVATCEGWDAAVVAIERLRSARYEIRTAMGACVAAVWIETSGRWTIQGGF
jgi:hypothetical protein